MDPKRREMSPRKSRLNPIRDVVFKFLVIGDYGVGKTAVVKRYTEGKFSSNYKTTIGADFSVKTILWDPSTRVSVQLWDIAGHERFNLMTRAYYKYAVGCAIVFDATRHNTFISAKKWLQDLREKVVLDNGRDIPVVLLANKWDIEEHGVTTTSITKFCKDNSILNWFPTSARNNTNISEAMVCLIATALENIKPVVEPVPDVIKLEKQKKTDNEPCCI
ncbi:ras-related protein Rab-32B [Halyomorpha halys]|uniref:ras-related protein Rab-32B n=1 Tax=Halyomorpha halys TaxID=286706 RepID=UPI0006D4F197|nr:ras-related protein Rab-32B-like [Halyomorpha halys]